MAALFLLCALGLLLAALRLLALPEAKMWTGEFARSNRDNRARHRDKAILVSQTMMICCWHFADVQLNGWHDLRGWGVDWSLGVSSARRRSPHNDPSFGIFPDKHVLNRMWKG